MVGDYSTLVVLLLQLEMVVKSRPNFKSMGCTNTKVVDRKVQGFPERLDSVQDMELLSLFSLVWDCLLCHMAMLCLDANRWVRASSSGLCCPKG